MPSHGGGATWRAVSSGTDNALRACWAPSPGAGLGDDVAGWVVGDDRIVLPRGATAL